MPDTNITIDAQGNVTRGQPGQMTELDIEQKGGHATGRTEHVVPKADKPATQRRTTRSKNMSLDQIIGRGGSGAGTESAPAEDAGKKPAATGTRGRKTTPKEPAAPKAAPAPKPEPAPAPIPAPDPPKDDSMWTKEAEQARDSGLPYLTTEHKGIALHFTNNDIITARNTKAEERDEWDQALVDFGDRVDQQAREAAERAEAIREAQERAAQPEPVPEPEPQPEPAPAPTDVQPEPEPKESTGGSRKLDLKTSTPTHQDQPQAAPQEEPAVIPAGQVLDNTSGKLDTPLRRVSYTDICTTLEITAKDLLASLQATGRGCNLGINPELYLYYITSFEGDTTYLFGYGSNIAYVRVRGGVLRDCNNRFGIDEVCAWVNEMTWVVRRVDG